MEKTINSHVYLAESILNRFSYKDEAGRNIIDYIDLNDMILESMSTRKFNRERGYYSKENELLLKANSEEKIGNVIKKLEECRMNNNININLTENEKQFLRKYLAYQWLRSDSIIKYIKDRLELSIPEAILKNIFIEDEENYKLFINRTKNLDIIIFFNNTNKQYIINSASSTLNSDSEDYFIINMVLTPNILVSFCKNGSIKKYLNINSDFIIKLVPDERTVLECNIHTMNVAMKEKPHFIVGKKEELFETVKAYESIKKDKVSIE